MLWATSDTYKLTQFCYVDIFCEYLVHFNNNIFCLLMCCINYYNV